MYSSIEDLIDLLLLLSWLPMLMHVYQDVMFKVQLPELRLTKRQENVFEFSEHHSAILHLVVQLQTLNEVLKGAGVLGVLDLLVDWVKLEIDME